MQGAEPNRSMSLALEVLRGLPEHSGWCPGRQHAPRSYESYFGVPDVLRLQRDLARQPDVPPNFPVLWYERALRHGAEVVWCERLLQEAERRGDCLLYVFGTGRNDWFIERAAQSHPGCRIFALDPTVKPRDFTTRRPKQVEFRSWGLGSLTSQPGDNWSHPIYGVVEGTLLSLGEIRSRLGHATQRITLMRADCEGCEWGWIPEAGDSLKHIDQLFIEFHFATTLRFERSVQNRVRSVHRLMTRLFRVAVAWQSFGFKRDQYRLPRELIAAGEAAGTPISGRACCTPMLLISKELAEPPLLHPSRQAELLHGAFAAWAAAGLTASPRYVSIPAFWQNYSKGLPVVNEPRFTSMGRLS